MNKKLVYISLIISLLFLLSVFIVNASSFAYPRFHGDVINSGSNYIIWVNSTEYTSNLSLWYNTSSTNTYNWSRSWEPLVANGTAGGTTARASEAVVLDWTFTLDTTDLGTILGDGARMLRIVGVNGTAPTNATVYAVNNSATNASTMIIIDSTAPTIGFAPQNKSLHNDKFIAKIVSGSLVGAILLGGNATDSTSASAERNIANCTLGIIFSNSSGRYETIQVRNNDTYNALTFNFSQHSVKDGKHTWGMACSDNATTTRGALSVNRGISSTNFTFFMDMKTPEFASTNPIWLDDSDTKDNSKSGTNANVIGGVYYSEVSEKITINCQVTDTSFDKAEYLIRQPGQSQLKVVKTLTSSTIGDSASVNTFTYTDTNRIGTYEVQCIGYDKSGKSTKSEKVKFLLQAEEEGEILGPVTAPAAPVSISSDSPKGSITRPQGSIFDIEVADTTHTVTITDVTATSATITISSTPSTFTLNIGENQLVDLDEDGTNDVRVTLSDIVSGQAKLDFDLLEGASVTQPEAEEKTTTIELGPAPEPEAKTGIGIWIIVAIVVIGVIIYFVVSRKKK